MENIEYGIGLSPTAVRWRRILKRSIQIFAVTIALIILTPTVIFSYFAVERHRRESWMSGHEHWTINSIDIRGQNKHLILRDSISLHYLESQLTKAAKSMDGSVGYDTRVDFDGHRGLKVSLMVRPDELIMWTPEDEVLNDDSPLDPPRYRIPLDKPLPERLKAAIDFLTVGQTAGEKTF